MSNVYRYRWGPKILRWIDKTGTVAIQQGDMVALNHSTGKIHAIAADSASAADFAGIAMKASPTTDDTATSIRVALTGYGTVFEFAVPSSTYLYGALLKISGSQALNVTATVTILSATNMVAIIAQDLETAGQKALVEFLPGVLQRNIINTGKLSA